MVRHMTVHRVYVSNTRTGKDDGYAARKEKPLSGLYLLSMVFRHPLRNVSGNLSAMS